MLTDYQTELENCKSRLAALPLEQLRQSVEDAETRLKAAWAAKSECGYDTLLVPERAASEHALGAARRLLENAQKESYPLRRRIRELERLINAQNNINGCCDRIQAATIRLDSAKQRLTTGRAALSQIRAAQADAAARLAELQKKTAIGLLQNAGIGDGPIQAISKSDFADAQNDARAYGQAVEMGTAALTGIESDVSAIQSEIDTEQVELIDARADQSIVDHATALGTYLPELARMMNACRAADKRMPLPDYVSMAREMI